MFLTLEDPRAKVKGSRDPLGLQPVWTSFGRGVVVNLTTVSTRVRGFTTLLIGRYITQKLVEEGRVTEADAIPVFLRWEQLAAYARFTQADPDEGILGISRVRHNAREGGGRFSIGNNKRSYILLDQKTYGLWGFYSVAGRESGWLSDKPIGLEPAAYDQVTQMYWPSLKPVWSTIRDAVLRDGSIPSSAARQPLKAIASAMPKQLRDEERVFYKHHLRDVAHSDQVEARRQSRLARLMLDEGLAGKDRLDRSDVLKLAHLAKDDPHGLGTELALIARMEAFLAAVEAIYNLMLCRNRKKPSEVAQGIRDRWGKSPQIVGEHEPGRDQLRYELLKRFDPTFVDHLMLGDEQLLGGDYEGLIQNLIGLNGLVMSLRGGAPWLEVTDGRLDVRHRVNEQGLPDGDSIKQIWRNSYFLNPLGTVSMQLEADDERD